MIDFARIKVRAGDGGSGAGSFTHAKGRRYGKADGGSGGTGGNVYIEATGDLNTLEKYRYVKDYKAEGGGRGLSQRCKGADARDLVLRVPVGTVVKMVDDGFQMIDKKQKIQNPESIIYDLTNEGEKVLVARGGEGGRGNMHLRDEYGRRPRAGESGEAGESLLATLELKLIADVGLIGLPNAGKSTLLSALTAARPAIADYPFTTLEPNLGVLSESSVQGLGSRKETKLDASSLVTRPLVIADIPGLIEGASQGRGLGDLFLRHIERTKLLVHLIAVSQSTGTEELWNNYFVVREELKKYSNELSKRKELIVIAKIDLIDRQKLEEIIDKFKEHRKRIIPISAVSGEGLDKLTKEVFKILQRTIKIS